MPPRDPPISRSKRKKPPAPLSEHALDARRKPKPPAPLSEHALDARAKKQQPAPKPPKPKATANQEVVRRQRLLRASGYPIVVDGIWGPASRRAWAAYTRKRSKPSPAAQPAQTASRHREPTPGLTAIQARQSVQAAAARARANAQRAVEDAKVNAATAAERQAIAKATRDAPRLAAAVRDAHGHREDVMPAQQALRRLHRERTTAIAVQEEKTRAVRFASKALRKRPEDLTTEELVAVTVDPITGHFDPQKRNDVIRVQRWLKAHGHPKLKVDGNYGPATNKALVDSLNEFHAKKEEAARQAIVKQLYGTDTIHPGDKHFPVLGTAPTPGELLKLLRAGGFTAQLVLNELIKRAIAPGPQYLHWRETELDRLAKVLYGPFRTPGFLQSKNATVVAATIASDSRFQLDQTGHSVGAEQVMALARSNTPQEFTRTLRQINADAERRFHELQADRSKDHGWWGAGVLDVLSKPSEWITNKYQYTAAYVVYTYHNPEHLLDLTKDPEVDRIAKESAREWRENHPWANLGMQMALDPLWLTGGLPTAGLKLTALGAVRAERLGNIIVAGERLVPARLVVGGALTLPAATGRTARSLGLALAHGTNPVARLTQVDHLVNFAKLAGAQKTEVIGKTRRQVRQAQRLLFRPKPAVKHLKTPGKAALKEIDLHAANVASDFQVAAPELYAELRGKLLSLHADDAASADSTILGALIARVADGARTVEIQRAAIEAAQEALSFAAQAGRKDGARLARQAYDDTVRKAGTYFLGGGDAVFNRLLDGRVNAALDIFRSVISAVQRDLELVAEKAGTPLFDESGRWVGRDAETANLLRRLGSEAYHDTPIDVANHNFNRAFTRDEMDELRQLDLERRRLHLMGYAARESAAGRPKGVDFVEKQLAEYEDELGRAWVERADGFYDTREKLNVPVLYLRHFASTYRAEAEAAAPGLAAIAQHPAAALTDPVEREIERLVLTLSGPIDGADQLARIVKDPALRRLALDPEHARLGDNALLLDQALQRGYAAALPKQMLGNFAVWQALLHAQSAPLRAAAKGATAWLDVWLTLTLPFRPGFLVRNVIDNSVKALVAGARDPRYYFPLWAAKGVRSVFDLDVSAMRHILSLGGRFQQNPALHYFDRVLDSFWQHEPAVIQKVFDAHGIPVPESVVDSIRHALPEAAPATATGKVLRSIGSTRDFLWRVMAAAPENYARRALYRETYFKAIRSGHTEEEAFELAVAKVEHTLFDYSKISLIEDNLRFIFPFVQFWRKTAQFWITESWDKPWLPIGFAQFEDKLRDDLHADWPEWMRRYVHTDVMTDALARIPGLKWLLPGLQAGAITDPANFFSFNVLYRTFKNENPNLPADRAGWAFLAPFIDAINDWGLSMNPLVRKPAEIGGAFNFRAWQSVFPETDLLDAISRRFWRRRHPEGLNIEAWLEDKVLQAIGSDFSVNEQIAKGFNQYVQMEMAEQALRGEPVDRDKAVEKIQDYYAVRTILGFFAGLYVRRMTPSDEHLYGLIDELFRGSKTYQDLSPGEQRAVNLFRRRKMDPVAYDRYVEAMPVIEAYYRTGSYQQGEKFKQRHPEVIPYVDPAWRGKPYSENYAKTAALVQDTQAAIEMYDLIDKLDVAHDLRQRAEHVFVTPELRDFWAQNDTPQEQRDKMVSGFYFQHVSKLNSTFHAIPEDDFDAKAGFIKEHPIVVHWWMQNNDPDDDLKAIVNASNAALRERYFEFVDKKDWDGAHAFLKRFPFIFEFTKAANRVVNGEWLPKTQHAKDYLRAKSALDQFFALLNGQGKQAAYAWLRGDSAAAELVRWYFARYAHGGKKTAHGRAYLAAKPALDVFFSILEKKGKQAAFDWLNKNGDLQKLARDYFDRWGKRANTPKAIAYRQARPGLNRFFDILEKRGKEAAFNWLRKDGPLQKLARDYFDTYGHRGNTPKDKAYRRARPGLDRFFDILEARGKDAAFDWLHKDGDLQKLAQDYFDKYGHQGNDPEDKAWRAAKHGLDTYFDILDKKGKDAAFDWLDGDGRDQKLVRDFFFEFGDHGDKKQQAAFRRAHDALQFYYELRRTRGDEVAFAWLDQDGPQQKLVRDYQFEYGDHGGKAQTADFVEAKAGLRHYYDLLRHDKQAAYDWLRSDNPDAQKARAYFKRWSKMNQLARKWKDFINSENPEINLRLRFWQTYWQLPPDQRMNYVLQHAEEHGVFVYGPIGETERDARLNTYLRHALQHHLTRKTALYLRIKPLLELFFSLEDPGDKELMLKANPDVKEYLDTYSTRSASGDPKVDKQLDAYFKLDRGSQERTDYLRAHPDLKAYFNEKATPAERAMYALLETYFSLPFRDRRRFLQQHPEIQAYFDKRKDEHDRENNAAAVFDLADPRLAAFFNEALATITKPGLEKQRQLARGRVRDLDITRRTDRNPTRK